MKMLLVLLAVAALAASPALGVQLDRRHLSKSYRVYAGDMASAGGEIQLTVGAKIDFTSAANDIKTACNSFITKLDNFGTNLFDNTVNNAFQLVVTEYNTFKALADNIIAVLPFGDIAAAVSKAANAPVPPVMADFNKMFQVSFGFSVPISNFFNLYKALISLMGAGDTVLNLGWLDRIPAAVSATGPLSKTGAFIETEKFLSSNNYIKRPQPTLLETYDMLLSNKADMAQHMRRMLTDDDINCNATLAATAVLNAAVDVVDMGLQAVDGLAQEWQTGFAVVGSIVKLIVGCCESICATLGHF